jgi:hypothetical protein
MCDRKRDQQTAVGELPSSIEIWWLSHRFDTTAMQVSTLRLSGLERISSNWSMIYPMKSRPLASMPIDMIQSQGPSRQDNGRLSEQPSRPGFTHILAKPESMLARIDSVHRVPRQNFYKKQKRRLWVRSPVDSIGDPWLAVEKLRHCSISNFRYV